MISIDQKLGIIVTGTIMVVVLGNTSPAEAFQFFDNRNEWEAALSVTPEILNFGEPTTILSGTTELPNGVILSGDISNGQGIAMGTGLSFFPTQAGSVRLGLNITLSNPTPALGFDLEIGPINKKLRASFISTEAQVVNPQFINPGFYGVIAEPNDPFISGFSISSQSSGTGFIQVGNISIFSETSSIPVPEPSSIVALLVIEALGTGLALLQRGAR